MSGKTCYDSWICRQGILVLIAARWSGLRALMNNLRRKQGCDGSILEQRSRVFSSGVAMRYDAKMRRQQHH
jgi:hypothetical protein